MILGSVLTAATIMLSGILQNTTSNSQHLSALYKAEEGIELVRNYRDTVKLLGISDDCGITEGIFTIAPLGDATSNNNCNILTKTLLEPVISGEEPERIIEITEENPDEFLVKSIVQNDHARIVLTEIITLWHPSR